MKAFLLVTAAALAALGLGSPAFANLVLDESVNGGGFVQICGGVNACSPGTTFTDSAGVQFTVLGASSNAPGTPTGADVTQASVRVTNNTGGTQMIVLRAGDVGFTAPLGAVVLSNQISGTVITGNPANLFSSMACADPTNGQNNCSGAFQTAAINSNITQSNSAGSNFNNIGIAALGAPFSLTELIDMTLGNNTVLTYTGSADVTPVSEPGTFGMLLVGMVGMTTLVEMRRRRRRR